MAPRPLPSLVVLGSPFAYEKFKKETMMCSPLYLGCAPKGSDFENHLKFDFKASDSAAKFMIEQDNGGGGLVHIKSCYNNKYWCRKDANAEDIVAEASERVGDKSTWKCTLFEIRDCDHDIYQTRHTSTAGKRRVVFRHVQTQKILHVYDYESQSRNFLTTKKYTTEAECVVVDYASLVMLPKRVVFKGHNDRYLTAARKEGYSNAALVFKETDLSSDSIVHEVYQAGDNLVCFKNLKMNQFWMQQPSLNVETYPHIGSYEPSTYFEVVKVSAEEGVVALRYVRENKYCRADGNPLTLKASANTITDEARLRVVEPVSKRTIKQLKYRLDEVKIYDGTPNTMAVTSGVNDDYKETDELKLERAVEFTESRTWNHSLGVTTGIETSFQSGIPRIVEAGFTVKIEGSYEHQWGKTQEDKDTINASYTMKLGPRTKGTLKLVATKSTCEIPFSYVQIDILSNGETLTSELNNGVYKGVQFHNFHYDTKREPLDGNHSGGTESNSIPINR